MANNSAPLSYDSVDNQSIVNFFDPALDVGDYGAITLKAQSVSGNVLTAPFYIIYKLPSYLTPENSQLVNAFKSCPVALFELCVSVP